MVIRRFMMKKKFTFDKFKPDIYLTDGQSLKEYGLNAKIIHIPGHTKGSLGIITDDGILFAGDTFTNRKKPDTATYIENSNALKNSMANLKKMNITTIYPGHGKPFEMEQIKHKL
jgi:glyoxylase-like metal-dependent hydrolase (beta-lactamase superfamily II)